MSEFMLLVMTTVMIVHVAAVMVLVTAGCVQHFSPSFRTWLVGPPAAKAMFESDM